MRSGVVVRQVVAEDIVNLAVNMRRADIDELHATGSYDVEAAIAGSIEDSSMVWSADVDGGLCAVFGCAPIGGFLSRVAAPWMLGTTELDRHPVALMRTCRGYVEHMHSTYPHLLNYVDVRNVRSVRWLRRLGFVILPPEPFGPLNMPFHKFEMR